MSVHALVVDTGKRRIVVDTCIGNDKERNIPSWSHLQTRSLPISPPPAIHASRSTR